MSIMKLQESFATAVYFTNGGHLALAQERDGEHCRDQAHVVLLSREHTGLLAAKLQELAADESAWETDDEPDEESA